MEQQTPVINNQSKQPRANTSTLNIKRCSLEDMPIVASLIRSSADWYRKFVAEKDMSEHDVGQAWIDRNFKKREFYLGRDENAEAIGFHSHQSFGKVAYLGYVYLDIKHVGKGYGKMLVDHARKISLEKGLEAMVLLAHPEATWATKAYEKYGFKRIASNKEQVKGWNNGMLDTYYEEGFDLYRYQL
jgi:ribosomal protein S18 acetylase RimI-like enzyme